MANLATLLKDPAGSYSAAYTSDVYDCNSQPNSHNTRGIVQVECSAGDVQLQARLAPEASWVTVKTYTENVIESVDLPYQFRAIVTGVGSKVWIGETR